MENVCIVGDNVADTLELGCLAFAAALLNIHIKLFPKVHKGFIKNLEDM
jgi:hypothetical protein